MKYLRILALLFCCHAALAQTPAKPDERTEEQKKKDWENFQKMVEARYHNDWPWLQRYAGDNEKVPAPAPGERRVIFMNEKDILKEGFKAGEQVDLFNYHENRERVARLFVIVPYNAVILRL